MFSDTNWWYSKPPCSSFQEQQVKFKGFLQWISKLVDFKVAFVSYSWSVVGSKTSWFIYTLPKYHGTSQDYLPLKRTPHLYKFQDAFSWVLWTPLYSSKWFNSTHLKNISWIMKPQGPGWNLCKIFATTTYSPWVSSSPRYLHRCLHSPFTTRLQTSSNSTSTMSSGSCRFKITVPFHFSKLQKFKTFLTLMYDSYFIASSDIQMPKQKIASIFHPPKFHQTTKVNWSRGSLPEVNHRKLWCCRPTFSPYQVEQQ